MSTSLRNTNALHSQHTSPACILSTTTLPTLLKSLIHNPTINAPASLTPPKWTQKCFRSSFGAQSASLSPSLPPSPLLLLWTRPLIPSSTPTTPSRSCKSLPRSFLQSKMRFTESGRKAQETFKLGSMLMRRHREPR